ncbi:Predicted enzyme related to lactoylglutathione lyase [Neisseria mucosa]|nr:lactoylglutathione lyase [Neisseria sp. HMSC055F11]SUA93721.1 Predicted enzyme related to lactoylglutathione lyase [Neisseria mucosa]
MKYDNFFFPADDLAASCSFYQDVLDLPVKFDFSENGMVAFQVGDEEAAIILKERKKFPDMTPTVWIEVEDVQAKYAALQGRNIRFLSEPFRIRTGWAVEFIDPSGNRLGFVDYRE